MQVKCNSWIVISACVAMALGCGDDNPAQVSVKVYGAEHVAGAEFSSGMPEMSDASSVVVRVTDPVNGEVLGSESTTVESGGMKMPEVSGGSQRRLEVALYNEGGEPVGAGNTPVFSGGDTAFRQFRTLVGPVEDFSRIGAVFSLAGGQESVNASVFDDSSLDMEGVGRVGHRMAETSTGQIVVVGGARLGSQAGATEMPEIVEVYNDIQLFDPATGHFTELGGQYSVDSELIGQDRMEEGRAFHSLTPLGEDRFLVAGGFGLSGESTRPRGSLEIIDLNASPGNRVQPLGVQLDERRGHHTATYRPVDGKVVIAGGLGTGDDDIRDTIEVVDPRAAEVEPGIAMTDGRVGHGAVLLEDEQTVWLTGGRSDGGTLSSTELVAPGAGGTESEPGFSMDRPREAHGALALGAENNQQVLLVGGYDNGSAISGYEMGTPLRSSEPFVQGGWQLERARGEMQVVMMQQSGDILIFGGSAEGVIKQSAERYRLDLNNVQSPLQSIERPMGEMRFGRLGAEAVVVNNGHVLVAGGQDGSGGARNDAEYFIGYDPVH